MTISQTQVWLAVIDFTIQYSFNRDGFHKRIPGCGWGRGGKIAVMKSADTPTGSVRVGVVSIPVMPITQKRVCKIFWRKISP